MTAPTWPPKRLISPGERTVLAERWAEDSPDLAAARAQRERAGLAGAHPSIVLPPASGLPECRELAGVCLAWLAVVLCALYLAVQLVRWVWVVIFG